MVVAGKVTRAMLAAAIWAMGSGVALGQVFDVTNYGAIPNDDAV